MSKIDKAAPGQGERALHDEELDAVSGGIRDEENFIKDAVNFRTPVVTMPILARFLAEDH
jgi:hypothetical protein